MKHQALEVRHARMIHRLERDFLKINLYQMNPSTSLHQHQKLVQDTLKDIYNVLTTDKQLKAASYLDGEVSKSVLTEEQIANITEIGTILLSLPKGNDVCCRELSLEDDFRVSIDLKNTTN